MFAGPVSESVPSSVTSFAHRKSRADSSASFTYFQQNDNLPEWPDDEAIQDDSDEELNLGELSEDELDARSSWSKRRRSSAYSVRSSQHPLLYHHGSSKSNVSMAGKEARIYQKIYVVTEDLTFVVTGFGTNLIGFLVYVAFCTITFGLGYLVLRWLPRWRVRLIGSPKSLQDCAWVVTEVRSLL